jgi:hypothetical protein
MDGDLACQVPACNGRRAPLDIVCPACWGEVPHYLKVKYWDAHKEMRARVRNGNRRVTVKMRSAMKNIVECLKAVATRRIKEQGHGPTIQT